MATLKQIAEGCGVSKPFVRKLVRELDPEESHVQTVGNRMELDAWLSSQVSAEALKRKPASPAEDGAKAIIEADAEARDVAELHHREVIQLKDEQIGILKEERDRLRSQVDSLMQQNADLQKLLSEAQKRRLAAAAEAAGMSLSAYIRTSLLDGPQRPVSVPREGEARARHVYLTDADWAALKYSAAMEGYTASAYIRDRCIGQDPRYDGRLPTAVLPSGEEMDRFRNCLTELLRQGNNWNQVARQINSSRNPDAELKLLCEHLMALTRQSQEIQERLENIFLAHEGK